MRGAIGALLWAATGVYQSLAFALKPFRWLALINWVLIFFISFTLIGIWIIVAQAMLDLSSTETGLVDGLVSLFALEIEERVLAWKLTLPTPLHSIVDVVAAILNTVILTPQALTEALGLPDPVVASADGAVDQVTPRINVIHLVTYSGLLMLGYVLLVLTCGGKRRSSNETHNSVYYMGFTLTLASLAAGLYTIASDGASGEIGQATVMKVIGENGIAVVSTIFGLVLKSILTLFFDGPDESDASDTPPSTQSRIEQLSEGYKNLEKNAKTATQALEGASLALTAHTKQLTAVSGLHEQLSQTTPQIVDDLRGAVNALSALTDQSKSTSAAAGETSTTIQETFAQWRAQADALLQNMGASAQQTTTAIQDIAKNAEQTMTAAARSVASAQGAIPDAAAALEKAVTEVSQRMQGIWEKAATEAATKAISPMNAATETFTETFGAVSASMKSASEQFAERMKAVADTLAETPEVAAKAAATQVNDALAAFRAHTEAIQESTEGYRAEAEVLRAILAEQAQSVGAILTDQRGGYAEALQKNQDLIAAINATQRELAASVQQLGDVFARLEELLEAARNAR